MQFSKLIALTLPALAFATPALEARQNDPQASVFIEKYLSSANTAVEDLTVFGCDVKGEHSPTFNKAQTLTLFKPASLLWVQPLLLVAPLLLLRARVSRRLFQQLCEDLTSFR